MFPYGVAVEPPSDGVGPPEGGVAGQVTCPRSSWSVSRVLPDCPYDVQSEATIIPAEFAPRVTSYICDGPQLSQPVIQKPTTPPVDEKSPVPHELYERSLSENRILHERLQIIVKETDDKTAFLESRNRELEERIAMMVSRTDYDILRAEFQNTVPKHEYDRVRTELSNTVPITHYDQLLDRIANMVPREIYMTSERRILELEDKLRHSVPFAVIDELANEVSYVSILAEVPPIVSEEPKKENAEEMRLGATTEENPTLS